ncbi:MAG: aminotransferase class I/II-fold pyridoxal phosphate-dependent enzyme [Bacteroidota bacterium]
MSAQTEQATAHMNNQLAELQSRYQAKQEKSLSLDMTRGKPSPEQLDLSNALLAKVTPEDFKSASGLDCRNYGGLDGMPATKQLFADFLEVQVSEVLVGDNASLSLMHDTLVNALLHGVVGSAKPWIQSNPKFICPAPGYDRHFNVCQHTGIDMLTVDNTAEGPDMDAVEKLVGQDDSIKGIWIVPRYSNPTGTVCSDEVVDRLAKMKTAASDFRIMWDNAYAVHHLTDSPRQLKNILAACKAAGHPDRVFIFGSTSKITFAGAGLAAMAGSEANIDWMRKHRFMQTIGPDKLNQLRHIRFFPNGMADVEAHMKKHAAILRPKFNAVLAILERELGGKGIASWTNPEGGYFISLDVADGCAKRVVQLAGEAGVKLTPAGASFPYRTDPRDRNIRIAPSLPSLPDLKEATEVLAICVQLAVAEQQ